MKGKLESIVKEIDAKFQDRLRDCCSDLIQQEVKQACQVGIEQFAVCVDCRFRKLEDRVENLVFGRLPNYSAQQDEGLVCCTSLQIKKGANEGSQWAVGMLELLSQTATSKGCSDKAGRQPE